MDENLIPADYRLIPGWTDFEAVYQKAVDDVPESGTLVEVGSWMGRSAAMMCTFLERADKAGKVRFFCVDTWAGSPAEPEHQRVLAELGGDMFDLFQNNLKPWRGCYTPLQMPSVEAARQFADHSADFVFIDAAHTTPEVTADIAAWRPKVKPGGVLAGHDINWLSVWNAVIPALAPIEIWDTSWVKKLA